MSCEHDTMSRSTSRLGPEPVVLSVPLRGSCRVQNSPANRVPSHGTNAFGSSYAIDLVPVDEHGRSAPRTWRGLITHELPQIFVGFGRPVLAPVAGQVQLVRDHEPDHEARRSNWPRPIHAGTAATSPAWSTWARPEPHRDRHQRRRICKEPACRCNPESWCA